MPVRPVERELKLPTQADCSNLVNKEELAFVEEELTKDDLVKKDLVRDSVRATGRFEALVCSEDLKDIFLEV